MAEGGTKWVTGAVSACAVGVCVCACVCVWREVHCPVLRPVYHYQCINFKPVGEPHRTGSVCTAAVWSTPKGMLSI